jgi:dCMP deaminase
MKAAVLYMPVLHKGYLNFINNLEGVDEIFVISTDMALDLQPSLRKDIRALSSYEMVKIVSVSTLTIIKVSELKDVLQLEKFSKIVLVDDELSRSFAKKHLTYKQIEFISVFLRWDSKNSLQQNDVLQHFETSSKDFDKKMMRACSLKASESSDWWRQVGGCIVKNGNIILPPVHNQHVPISDQPYYNGDPRGNFKKGENIEIGTALHVELNIIAMAAEIGFSLSGTELYVTTFPCPWCAKAIAYSGIEKVYFEEGYSVLDAQSILEANDVKIIRVIK